MGKVQIIVESDQLDEKALEQLAISMIPSSQDWKEGCYQMTGARPANFSISYPNKIDNDEPIIDEYEPTEEELSIEEQEALDKEEQELEEENDDDQQQEYGD
jgi:hypothetical protein